MFAVVAKHPFIAPAINLRPTAVGPALIKKLKGQSKEKWMLMAAERK
jgi:hypothetical protein